MAAAVGLAFVLWPEPVQKLVLADGREVTIVKVTYGMRHHYTFGPLWVRALAPFAPERWKRQAGGGTLDHKTPANTLMVWAEWNDSSTTNQPASMATIGEPDAQSKRVYPIAWGARAPAQPSMGWAFPNFPRRQKILALRVYDVFQDMGMAPRATFGIPNPARFEGGQWTPSPLPQTRAIAGVQLVLTQWVAAPSLQGEVSTLRFVSSNAPLESLMPSWLEVSDRPGNLWRHWVSPEKFGAAGELSFRQPLWTQEEAFLLRVEFLQPLPSKALHRVLGVPLPASGPDLSEALKPQDAQMRLDRLFCASAGGLVDGGQRRALALFTVLREPMRLVAVADETGLNLKFKEAPVAERDQYGVSVQTPASARSLDFTFQLCEARWVEFLVAPPQLKPHDLSPLPELPQ